jgi:hypothetical protein
MSSPGEESASGPARSGLNQLAVVTGVGKQNNTTAPPHCHPDRHLRCIDSEPIAVNWKPAAGAGSKASPTAHWPAAGSRADSAQCTR